MTLYKLRVIIPICKGGNYMSQIKLSKLLNYEDGLKLICEKLGHEYEIAENLDDKIINICTLSEAKGNK